jgi:hypothetical protein
LDLSNAEKIIDDIISSNFYRGPVSVKRKAIIKKALPAILEALSREAKSASIYDAYEIVPFLEDMAREFSDAE